MKQKKRNSFAVLGYTKNMMAPMVAFTAAANAIFAALDNRGVRADRAGSHRRIRTLPRGADRQTVLIIAHRMRTVDGVDNEGRQGSRNGHPGGAEKGRRDLQAYGGYAAQFRAVEIPVMEEEYE